MTSDYNSYSYSRLLNYLSAQSTDNNYSECFLAMNQSTTIQQMVDIYNKIYGVIMTNGFTIYELELNRCFNENLKRLCKTTKSRSEEFCYACISNLRRNKNIDKIVKELSAIRGASTAQTVQEIKTALMHYYDATCEILLINPDQYATLRIETVVKYYANIEVLQKYGFQKTDAENRLEKAYKLAELRHSINLDVMGANVDHLSFEDYYRVPDTRKNEAVSNKTKDKRQIKKWQGFFFAVICGIAVFFIMEVIDNAIGGLPGLFIIIGLPGALISFLKKGKL